MTYIDRYGLWGCIRLLLDVFLTKFIIFNARIIRRPIDIRGLSRISVSRGFTTGRYCRIEAHSETERVVLHIGKNCQINDSVHIAAANDVIIGNNVLIASRVFITDLNHGGYKGDMHSHPSTVCSERPLQSTFIHIEDNVWLGEGVVVLPGVIIGECSIIGANSVVSHDIPANAIAVGNPAKVIKKFNFEINEWVSVNG